MMKKLALVSLLFLLFQDLFSQSIYYTEQNNGRIRRAGLGPTSIGAPVNFITGLTFPSRLVVAQNTSKLYYLTGGGGDLVRANLTTGAFESTVITEGAMAELYDIAFYPDDDAIFAANSPEVYGAQYIPGNNNDSGLDFQVDLGYMTNDIIANIEVDNDQGMLYFVNPDALSVVKMQIGSANPQILATLATPTILSYDGTNNDIYFVALVSSQYRLYRYDLDLDQLSPELANLGSNDIDDINVYPGYNKVYYSVYNTGIYSVPMSGGSPTSELALAGVGSIYFGIQYDLTPPVFTALSPADNATNTSTTATFTITFDQTIQKSTTAATGTESQIRLMRTSDNVQISVLDRTSANITVTGSQATISFPTTLNLNTGYYILIGNKVFRDPSANNFVGISLPTGWNFTTKPGVSSSSPNGNACVGSYSNYSNITLTEGNAANFSTGNQSLTFGFSSAGYSFESGVGSITKTSGADLTINSFNISSSTITINYTAGGTSSIDQITIAGLHIQSNSGTNPATTIIRTGGTGTVDGLVANTPIDTIGTQAQAAGPAVNFGSGNMICLNGNPDNYSVTATGGSVVRWYTQDDLLPASVLTPLNDMTTVNAGMLGIASTTTSTTTRYVRQEVAGCISLSTPFDFVVVDAPQVFQVTSSNVTSCVGPNGSVSVTDIDGNGTVGYTIEWRDAGNVVVGNTATVTNLPEGFYSVSATLNGCQTPGPSVGVGTILNTPVLTMAVSDNTTCNPPNGTITAIIENFVGQLSDYTFTWHDGPDSSFPVNPTSTGQVLAGIPAGTYMVEVFNTPSGCSGTGIGSVLNNTTLPIPGATAGDVCESAPGTGTANVNLTTYNSSITSGDADLMVTWKDGSGNQITSALVSNNQGIDFDLRRISTGCTVTSTFVFAVHPAPTLAAAGSDQIVCGVSTILAANLPTSGTGNWTILSGTGGVVTSPANHNSNFTGVVGQTYVLEWSISTGAGFCPPSVDNASITFNPLPSVAAAGSDQLAACSPATLAANTPVSGTGAWSVFSGTGGVIANSAQPGSSFTGTAGTSYTLRWTITNSCGSTFDDVVIAIPAPPSISAAGPDQSVCGTSTTLAANTPSSGTGTWTIISGIGGNIANSNSPASIFAGTPGSTYSLRWRISDGCTFSDDLVSITMSGVPTVANGGADKNVCGTTVPMTGNAPTVGTGTWSIVAGSGGSFTTPSSPTTNFTGVAGTTYTLRWTITNGSCTASTDDVLVSLVAPPTVAAAGADQSVCVLTATLAANTPAIGTGTWSVVTGAGGTVNSPLNALSTFTGTADVQYTLRWTVTNGICPPSTDDVLIKVTNPITTAQAGPDQTICGTTVTLAANTPSSGTGAWTVVSGSGGTFASSSNPVTTFTGVAGGAYTLRWTISKTSCNPSADDVNITLKSTPLGSGSLGPAVMLCIGTSSTLTVGGYTNVDSYAWNVPAGFNSTPSTGSSLEFTGESGTGGAISVTPVNGCGNGTPASVQVSLAPIPSITINLPPPAYMEEPVSFSFTSDIPVANSEWSLGDGATSTDPTAEHAYGAAGDFQVSLTLTSQAGCVNTTTETYTVLSEPDLNDYAIKNVITANGDDKNRVLFIENLDRHPENEVRFLDRWGVEIFSKTNYQNDWEARGKDGQFLPAGQYICIVKLGSGKVFSRTVSIIKGR